MTPPIRKYPRTRHIEGSRLQSGDDDLGETVAFAELAGKQLTVEEKIDGANCAVSFDAHGELLLQSRGHYLIGGVREKHFNLFKQWAVTHSQTFYETLGSRFVMYGEWVYAKHTIFYDALPHYFLEFDVLDRETDMFLDTLSRRQLLASLPVVPVPVICRKAFRTIRELTSLIGNSRFISEGHITRLLQFCDMEGLDRDASWNETDHSMTMEGLYIKLEDNGQVIDRFKFVRKSFLQTVIGSGTHWLARPIIPNGLQFELDMLFMPELPEDDAP